MKTALDSTESQFRPVNIGFLMGETTETFNIYYKTEAFGTTRFVKFASTNSSHQDKVRKLIEENGGGNTEEFFIQQDDLMKYYSQATSHLKEMIANPKISFQEKTEKIYNVSKEIMKNFFEFNASPKVLKSSEKVVEIMDDCLSGAENKFHAIFAITNRDYYTYTHSVNVGLYCLAYGIKTKMGPNDIRNLGLGGMLHDVGKAKIDPDILNKKGKLTNIEFETMKTHSSHGQEILETMQCYGTHVVDMAREHHENFNGTGYPRGLAGKEITFFARVCKVMDVYDALTTRRSYKKALAPYEALTIMKMQMIDEFDIEILENFIKYMGPDL